MSTILLVDDANLMLQIETALFRRTGAQILTASNGTQALRLILDRRPDLVVLDLMLPDITGDRICEQIKKNPETAKIPVIIVTTRGKPEDVERCRQAGCDDFTTKPVNHQELLMKAAQLMKLPHRRCKRVLVRLEMELGKSGDVYFGNSIDLSETGMSLETARKMENGESLQLRFFLPDHREVTVLGKILRTERAEFQKFRYAIEFLDLAAEERALIRELIRSSTVSASA